MRKLELLAPAKDLKCGIAAIDCGADAVYIGAARFGARQAVGNSIDDINELCEYAHKFGCKVYVTVNTIIYDNELEDTQNSSMSLEGSALTQYSYKTWESPSCSFLKCSPPCKYANRQPLRRESGMAGSAQLRPGCSCSRTFT